MKSSFGSNKSTPQNKISPFSSSYSSSKLKGGSILNNQTFRKVAYFLMWILMIAVFIGIIYIGFKLACPDANLKYKKGICPCKFDKKSEGFLAGKTAAQRYANCKYPFEPNPGYINGTFREVSDKFAKLAKDYYTTGYVPCVTDTPDYLADQCCANCPGNDRTNKLIQNTGGLQYNSLEADGNSEVAKRETEKRLLKGGLKSYKTNKSRLTMNNEMLTGRQSQGAVAGSRVTGNLRVNSGQLPETLNRPSETFINSVNTKQIKNSRNIQAADNNFTINDRGYGQPEAFLPIPDTPALHTNSRVAGSGMSLNALGGTFLKKYNVTEDYLTNNNGLLPQLNICDGNPKPMTYCEHPEM